MCDPIVGTVIAGVSALASGAEAINQSSQIAAVQDKQNAANAEWVAYQTKARNDAQAAEEADRQKASAAQQDTLAKVTPQAQEAAQGTEQARLNTLYTQGADPNATANPASLALSGEKTGDSTFMGGLTSAINNATSQARKRIAALATANSYGGSFGGLGTTVPEAFTHGGEDINLQNNMRQGNLKVFGVQQAVQPLQYAIGPGTEQAGGIAKALASVAGTVGSKSLASSGWLGGAGAGGGGNSFLTMPDDGGYIDDSMFGAV